MIDMGLESLVTYNPLAVTPGTTLDDALNWMDEYHFRHLPVVDEERQLVGIVSDLDVRRAAKNEVATVGDIMTPAPAAVTHHTPSGEALRVMLSGRFHSLPVVENNRLIGIITSSDYLREFSYGGLGSDEQLSAHTIEDARIDSAATIDEARAAMDEVDVDCLAVLKGELPVGVVARRSILIWNGFSEASSPSHVKVVQLATTNIPVMRPTDTLQDAARQMLDRGVQVVLVADRANRFQGIVTERVLLAVMEQRLSETR